MVHITAEDIERFHHIYRINLINSCSGYKSANLIGSVSLSGVENVAVFSSLTHIGSNPPILGFFLRPTTVPRNTYQNIKDKGFYTINHIHEPIVTDAHHTSAKYDASVSEFHVTNLESEYKDGFPAPFVKSAPLQIGMKYLEEYSIKANNTILVLGQIQNLYVQEHLLESDGFIDLSKGNIAAINGLDGYAIPKSHNRYGYQRPKAVL